MELKKLEKTLMERANKKIRELEGTLSKEILTILKFSYREKIEEHLKYRDKKTTLKLKCSGILY